MFEALFHSSWLAAMQCPDAMLICLLQACWSRCWTAAAATTSARRAGGSGSWMRCWPCCAARCSQPHLPGRLIAGSLCHLLVIGSWQDDASKSLCIPMQPAERVIVFCNKIDTCRVVENALNRASGRGPEHGGGASGGGGLEDDDFSGGRQHSDRSLPLTVLPYHAAITPPQRLANLQVQSHAV